MFMFELILKGMSQGVISKLCVNIVNFHFCLSHNFSESAVLITISFGKEMLYLTTHSTHSIVGRNNGKGSLG